MIRVAIIIGSTRPNRVGEGVARWVFDKAQKRNDIQFELIDIEDYNLPLLDEPISPAMSDQYTKPHTKAWSRKISSFDGFVFVSPEYNHGTSGALKNAIDFLYKEWNNKVAGFVAYGTGNGIRAVEHLRLVMAELQVATVRTQLALNLRTDFENYKVFTPAEYHENTLNVLFDQLVLWGTALKNAREKINIEMRSSKPQEDRASANLH